MPLGHFNTTAIERLCDNPHGSARGSEGMRAVKR
jgi:hypothetical protein